MLTKRNFGLFCVALVLGLALLLSGCSSTNEATQGIEGEGNVAIKLSNTKLLPQDSSKNGIKIKVFNQNNELVKNIDVEDTQQESMRLNLSEGTYSIEAIGYEENTIKNNKSVYEITGIGQTDNIIVKNNSDIYSEIQIKSLLEFSSKNNTVTTQVSSDFTLSYGSDSGILNTQFDSWLNVYDSYTFSNTAIWDLSNASHSEVPLDQATVTKVEVEDNSIDGRYYGAHIKVVTDNGSAWTNSLGYVLDELDGQPVKQNWGVKFYVEELYSYDATMAPKLSIYFDY